MDCVLWQAFQLQTGETLKVAIPCAEDGAMFDGDSGQVSIRGEIAASTRAHKQAGKQASVATARVEDACVRVVDPLIDQAQGLLDLHGGFENTRLGAQAQEAQQRYPREPDASRFGECLFQPARRGGLLRAVGVDRV